MEAAYLQMVGRDSWSDLCFEDKAEWACETSGMDAQSIGVLQLQMNGRYDAPYLEDLADRGINAVMSTLAYYDETEDHMDWIMAVDHAGTPIMQKSCSSIYHHLPDPPVCAQDQLKTPTTRSLSWKMPGSRPYVKWKASSCPVAQGKGQRHDRLRELG